MSNYTYIIDKLHVLSLVFWRVKFHHSLHAYTKHSVCSMNKENIVSASIHKAYT